MKHALFTPGGMLSHFVDAIIPVKISAEEDGADPIEVMGPNPILDQPDVHAVPDDAAPGWQMSADGAVSRDTVATYFVDDDGNRFHEAGEERSEVECAWTDRLVKDGDTWRAETAADQSEREAENRAQAAKAECARRIVAVVDPTAQINLAAAASAGVLTDAQASTYRDGVAWIGSMRARWGVIAEDDSIDMKADTSWPAAPAKVVSLAEAF